MRHTAEICLREWPQCQLLRLSPLLFWSLTRNGPGCGVRKEKAMNKTIKVAAALSAAGVLALTGCSSDSSGGSGGDTVNVVGYSVLQQANEGVIDAFNDT